MRTNKLRRITILGLVLFLGTFGLLRQAAAQVPRPNVVDGGNRWLITGYFDASPVHQQAATQGICYLPYAVGGTHIAGVWYSDTYPGWRGHYSQEGDLVLMHGNWARFGGSDGMFIDLFAGTSPRDIGGGQWTEWFNTGAFGTTVAFGNARLTRVGKCQLPRNAHATQMGQGDLERLAVELSDRVKPRMRKDGKPAESPADPDQVPLPEEKQYLRP
jgi:hypothetical protein